MTDIELRKAVADAAGWEWYDKGMVNSLGDSFEYATVRGIGRFPLRTDRPLLLDDLFAACEAAGVEEVTIEFLATDDGQRYFRVGVDGPEYFASELGPTAAEAMARALVTSKGGD